MTRALALASVALGLVGCTSRAVTTTPRSAIEQLLLSAAVDKAMERLEVPEVVGKKVFLDFTNLQAYDAEYIKVATRARFAKLGALLVDRAEDADCVAEVASGGLGIEFKSTLVGLPALPVPNMAVPTPELSVYRTTEQTAILKLLVFIHQQGRFVAAHHYYGKADRDESFVLWHRFQKRDEIREGWERADLELDSRPSAGRSH